MQTSNGVDQFNMVIVGTGGQGLITLLQIIAEAALFEGLDIKTSELHGLSQRGGSVEVHIKLGKKVYSPLIPQGRADLVLGLEMQETLRAVNFANQKTKLLINRHIIPIPLVKNLAEKEILDSLKKISKNINLISASEICKEKLGSDVVSGIYLMSLAVFKGLIPIKPSSIEKAIKKIIPDKYLGLNLKTFNLAKS
ncbi:MAG TPA: indolepyruvate oxidoreductase subunit beta [Candidatus Humimicrobiaceae bacterium]|nr:indolepyruvate oxidoreductase subunit beta [Candidatus Humimicrobiaceae bacterium]